MNRHIFLIPGFFGFANLGDFAYCGSVYRQLNALLEEAGMRIVWIRSNEGASAWPIDIH